MDGVEPHPHGLLQLAFQRLQPLALSLAEMKEPCLLLLVPQSALCRLATVLKAGRLFQPQCRGRVF
jgi:hypothetical protein